MNTYAERLAWAMKCRGLSPQTDQSTLAKRVGPPCKGQNIQHLLDPNKNAKSSKYTPRIADVLRCEVLWLAEGVGKRPEPDSVSAIDSSHEIIRKEMADKSYGLADNGNTSRVNPSYSNLSGYGKVPNEQLDEFIAELKATNEESRLTPHRFFLLRELLREGTESPGGSIEKQQLKTRGGHGRRASTRGKTGTGSTG